MKMAIDKMSVLVLSALLVGSTASLLRAVDRASVAPTQRFVNGRVGRRHSLLLSFLSLQGPEPLDPSRSSGDLFRDAMAAMQHFDAEVSRECSAIYGQDMLLKMWSSRTALCRADSERAESSLICHQRVPFDIPRYMCELSGVRVSDAGTFVAGCEPDLDRLNLMKLGNAENWVFGRGEAPGHGLRLMRSDGDNLACSSHVELLRMVWGLGHLVGEPGSLKLEPEGHRDVPRAEGANHQTPHSSL